MKLVATAMPKYLFVVLFIYFHYYLLTFLLFIRFSEECTRLLKAYWNLQRKLCDRITLKNYKSLINLAFTHAKICQSEFVDIVDACFAIYYMEEYTSTFLNFSILDFSATHHNNIFSYGDCLVGVTIIFFCSKFNS